MDEHTQRIKRLGHMIAEVLPNLGLTLAELSLSLYINRITFIAGRGYSDIGMSEMLYGGGDKNRVKMVPISITEKSIRNGLEGLYNKNFLRIFRSKGTGYLIQLKGSKILETNLAMVRRIYLNLYGSVGSYITQTKEYIEFAEELENENERFNKYSSGLNEKTKRKIREAPRKIRKASRI